MRVVWRALLTVDCLVGYWVAQTDVVMAAMKVL